MFIETYLISLIWIYCQPSNGELISVRKHNYNCMLDDGVY